MDKFLASAQDFAAFKSDASADGNAACPSSSATVQERRDEPWPLAANQWQRNDNHWWQQADDGGTAAGQWWQRPTDDQAAVVTTTEGCQRDCMQWQGSSSGSWEASADDRSADADGWTADGWTAASWQRTSTACPPPPPPPASKTNSSRSADGWRPRGGANKEWYTVFHAVKKTGATDEVAKKTANATV